jgi:hypothetical protein
MKLLEVLADVEIAVTLVKDQKKSKESNAMDKNYESLKCDIGPLDKKSQDFKVGDQFGVRVLTRSRCVVVAVVCGGCGVGVVVVEEPVTANVSFVPIKPRAVS